MHTAAKYHLASQLGGFLLPILKKKVRHTFYVTLYQYQRAQRQANNMPNTAKLQLQFKPTRSSATADGPCSTQCQLKSCLLLNSCTGHITLTTPICNEFVILRLTLDIAHLRIKFDDSNFNHSTDMIGPPKFQMSSHPDHAHFSLDLL